MSRHLNEIDGWRAVAVILVIIFHAEIGGLFAGGFIGVDIFFVISGFVITRSLFHKSTYEPLSHFYVRRVCRLLPALVFCLLGTAYLSSLLLAPIYQNSFLDALKYTALISSNWYFFSTLDYFNSLSIQPLLHMWSLSIEEQFYLVFPALFYISVLRKRLWLILALVTLASLSFSVISAGQSEAYYNSLARFWQLAIGGFVAHTHLVVHDWAKRYSAILKTLGALSVFFSATLITPSAQYPGYLALAPTLGMALVLYSISPTGEQHNRILNSKIASYIGKLSYSLYLWHFPILIFSEAWTGKSDLTTKLLAIGVTLLLSVLTYHALEKPSIAYGRKATPRKILLLYVLATVVLVYISLTPFQTQSSPAGIKGTDLSWDYFSRDRNVVEPWREHRCFLRGEDSFSLLLASGCAEISDTEPNIMLVGDSYAAALYPGLNAAFGNANILQLTVASCSPFKNQLSTTHNACNPMKRFVYSDFNQWDKIDLVVLMLRWSDLENQAEQALKSIAYIEKKGVRVLVGGPLMSHSPDLASILRSTQTRTLPVLRENAHYAQVTQAWKNNAIVKRKIPDDNYIPFLNYQCPNGEGSRCTSFLESGHPTTYDGRHLTIEGSEYLVRAVDFRRFLN